MLCAKYVTKVYISCSFIILIYFNPIFDFFPFWVIVAGQLPTKKCGRAIPIYMHIIVHGPLVRATSIN